MSNLSILIPDPPNQVVFRGPRELVRGSNDAMLASYLPVVRRQPLLLDLSATERIDAAGIAALITLYCTGMESGTGFAVCEPSAHVSQMLRIVGLEPILVHGHAAEQPAGLMPQCCTAA